MRNRDEDPLRVVLLALDIDLSIPRGDAVHVRELARFLAKDGPRVELITATAPDSVPDLGGRVRHHRRPDASNLAVVRFCAGIARESQAQIVYERRLSPKIAFGVSRLTGIPYVLEVNGVEEEAAMLGHASRSASAPVKRRVRSLMYRRAARVVTVSQPLAEIVRRHHRLPAEKIVVIPNGVDPERFYPRNPESARDRLGWPDGEWIVFVGNLVPWQGVDVLVRATPRVFSERPKARLGIVGDGPLRGPLEAAAKKIGSAARVTFAGAVPHEFVPGYIGAATACAAPFTRVRNSAIGVSPLKLYEYLACGRPVVASDVPGVREVLEACRAGVVVPPEDPDALADAIVTLLQHPEEALAMGRRGRDHVATECTWARTADRVTAVLREALHESHR